MQGTAYRLSSRFAVTSEHVVRGIRQGDPVRLRFPKGERQAILLKSDAEADCALLELSEPFTAPPLLPLSSGVEAGAAWEAVGYVSGTDQPTRLLSGEIQTVEGEDPQRGPAIVLRPSGALPPFLAGSPVLCGGQVIGHLKSRLAVEDAAHALYACPIRLVEALIPAEPETKRRTPQPPQAAYDPAWYIAREEEEQKALGYLDFPGQPVVLWAPELFGKTWLLRHLIQRVQKQDQQNQVVAINLDLFDKSSWHQPQGLDPFLRELALHVALSLGESAEDVHREWTTSSPTANLDRVMRKRILPRVTRSQGRLLLAIDRADAVLGSPIQNTFFGILRGWAESEDAWSCLRLVLSISTTPALLVSSQHQSPFNLTDAVELKDLRDAQILSLCRLYQLKWGKDELSMLRHWVGGHPYLVRLAMYTAVRQGVSLEQLFEGDHPASGVFEGFLNRIGERLRRHPERFEALQRVLADPRTDLGASELPLLRAGLLYRDDQDRHLPRYELYRRLSAKTPSGRRLSTADPVTAGSAIALMDTGLDLKPSQRSVERIEVGKQLGPYQVLRELGRGGMGVVFEVRHDQLKRRAALKVLHPQFSRDPEIAQRFLNEARAANVIQHASIINIYEMGQLKDGATYFVMEYLEGESLGDRLEKSGKLSLSSALRLSHQIAAALAAAHNTGVVHRDLKPDNVMTVSDSVVPGGKRVKILDFGLAKVHKRAFDDAITTERGALMGTPVYMAPEQCRGADLVDAKADVYSLGVMLYEFLHGEPPFMAKDPGDVMAMHLRDKPVPLGTLEPLLPKELTTLVDLMLSKDPAARPLMSQVSSTLQSLESQYVASASTTSEKLPVTPSTLAPYQIALLLLALLSVVGVVLAWLLPHSK